jgi:hypothetical protein
VRERSIQPSISLMRLRATGDRRCSLLIVSLSDQTLIALEWGGLTPLLIASIAEPEIKANRRKRAR